MSKIEMMEVNQHTSDEVAKVLEDLEAQGVDIAAVGANIEAIKTAIAGSVKGGKVVKSIQSGFVPYGQTKAYVTSANVGSNERSFYKDIAIQEVVPENCFVSFECYANGSYPYVFTSAKNMRVYVSNANTSTTAVSPTAFSYTIIEFA